MKNRLYDILPSVLLLLSLAGSAQAQISGNPVGTSGTKEWTVSASGTYFYQYIGNTLATSNRFLAKSGWGVVEWLDAYLVAGASNLVLDRQDGGIVSDYRDVYRFTYGAGINALVGDRLQLWFGGSALRFQSEGDFREPLIVGGQTYVKRFEMNYDWREVKAYLGIVMNISRFKIYCAGAGWHLWRIEKKKEYRDSATSTSYVGNEQGEFASGLYTGAIVGIEMSLPQRFSISLEALLFNESNLQIMAGISQTGWQGM
ncbi:hypothetical protein JXO52_01325 [bacterium]|nr:hypothetical protein [bacterium]